MFYFGHGKTYLNTFKYSRLKLDIDSINEYLAVNNRKLVEYGVFYNDNDLDFRKDEEGSSNVIDKLIENCSDLKKIYLLKKTTVYGRILKEKILSLKFNRNNFQIVFCNALDEVKHELSATNRSISDGEHEIPGIKPPKRDFHSKFFN